MKTIQTYEEFLNEGRLGRGLATAALAGSLLTSPMGVSGQEPVPTEQTQEKETPIQIGIKNIGLSSALYKGYDVMYYPQKNYIGITEIYTKLHGQSHDSYARYIINIDNVKKLNMIIEQSVKDFENLIKKCDSLRIENIRKDIAEFKFDGYLDKDGNLHETDEKIEISFHRDGNTNPNNSLSSENSLIIRFGDQNNYRFDGKEDGIDPSMTIYIRKQSYVCDTYREEGDDRYELYRKQIPDLLKILDVNYIKSTPNKMLFDYQKKDLL